MFWVKNILAGAVAFFILTVLSVVVRVVLLLRAIKIPQGGEVGIDLVGLVRSPRFWIVPLVGFGLGFWWQYRRASP